MSKRYMCANTPSSHVCEQVNYVHGFICGFRSRTEKDGASRHQINNDPSTWASSFNPTHYQDIVSNFSNGRPTSWCLHICFRVSRYNSGIKIIFLVELGVLVGTFRLAVPTRRRRTPGVARWMWQMFVFANALFSDSIGQKGLVLILLHFVPFRLHTRSTNIVTP